MPIHFRADEELGLAEAIFEGRVTEQEIEDAIERYLSPEYAELPLGLFDFRGVSEAAVASEVIRRAAGRISSVVDPGLKRGKLAIVAEREEIFGLARMYQILRDPSPVEVKVFQRLRDAQRWLGVPLAGDPE